MAGVRVVKRLVTGAKERTVSHAGDWSTALGLQRSHTKTKPNTEKRKEYLHTLNLAHASFLQNINFFRHVSPIWSYSQAFLLYLMHFLRRTSIFPQREDVKVMPDTQIWVLLRRLICFWVVVANARGHGPTVEAGAKSTYGHRASREYKGQTPFIAD